MCSNDEMYFLKFMSLENTDRFLQIITNNQLYASEFEKLNDPMEGIFKANKDNHNIINEIFGNKKRICALTRESNLYNILMWSHYAKFHSGCCFKVSIDGDQPKPVEYNYDVQTAKQLSGADIDDLLLRKFPMWEYEDEVRCLTMEQNVSIQIHKVYFGYKVKKDDENFRRIIDALTEKQIPTEYIRKEELQKEYIEYLKTKNERLIKSGDITVKMTAGSLKDNEYDVLYSSFIKVLNHIL